MIESSEYPSPGSQSRVLSGLAERLEASGLNLCALLPVESLEPRWQAMLPEIGSLPVARQTLLLAGNAGPDFWTQCRQSRFAGEADQVDRYAVDSCRKALQALPAAVEQERLYPSIAGQGVPDCGLSLQALGKVAGWHQESPLGIGIHPEHGLWFAYRCMVLIDAEPPRQSKQSIVALEDNADNEICLNCETQDCIRNCPPKALVRGELPDIQRCFGERLQAGSECAGQCLARNACPVGAASRYTAEQTDYHYRLSLASIRRYIEQ